MRYLITIVLASIVSFLSGCERYLLTFNEQPVYTPPSLFSGYQIDDEALRTCVAQTLSDAQVTHAKNLLGLNCAAAGITDLDGLEIFASLETLILVSNNIVHLGPLLSMPSLVQVDLSDNASLNCAGIERLKAQGSRVTAPQHCQD